MEQFEIQERIGQLERKIATLTELVEITTQVNSTIHLDELLSNLMDIAARITGCEAASVLLWNQQTRELFFAATTSDNPLDLIGKPIPLDGSIAGTIMRERKIVQVDDASTDPRHNKSIQEEQGFVTHNLLGVPMTVKSRLIGVLEVINKREMPWTEDDRQYLAALASQAAIAIEGAQLVRSLKRANEELSQVDKLKNDFIAIASHELRTPLGVILGYASFLQEETTTDREANEHATKVMDSALRLRKIIEDLTNLRYLQQNAADLHLAELAVEQLLKDVRFDVLNLLAVKQLTLDIQPIPEGVSVNVDRARLAMALTRILDNAIEFSPQGSTITIRTEVRGTNEVWIHFTDNGIGIPEDKLEQIFEKFVQVESHMIRHHEGLGIGLSICRALIEAHKGRVWATSEGKDKGSTFIVSLPLASAHKD